jgi:hypothetical protein
MSDDLYTRAEIVTLLRHIATEAGVSITHEGDAPQFVLLHWLADRLEQGAAIRSPTIVGREPYIQCATCEAKLAAWMKRVKS